MREVKNEQGEHWLVYEVQRSASASDVVVPEPLRAGWLCFESATHKRRVAPIPAKWNELSEAGLLHLSREVPVVPKRHL
jgi:hypothetical protein